MSQTSNQPLRLIVGLGNPGPRYESTRHNAGFWFVDLVARRHGLALRPDSRFLGEIGRLQSVGRECWLLKPTTFMNRSGQSLSSLASYFKIPLSQILVAHDELDLPPGTVRLKRGGGHAGHNGLRDIVKAMDGREFWRLRIGIGRPDDSANVVDYVLGGPTRMQADAINQALLEAERVFPQLQGGQFQLAMQELHSTQ